MLDDPQKKLTEHQRIFLTAICDLGFDRAIFLAALPMKTYLCENTGMAPRGLCNMLKEYRETTSVEKGLDITRNGSTTKIEQDKLDIVQ
ncbi:hypothetical protein SARC_03009, partial [Sphaeroforma arctica JP610]